ncbi:hypothetical protein AMECASPLE_016498 [Ameca splendens]|uniref:Uncharacterized protein n=1 Tax=Ameca splendens TaxID=208324 RepID=A0ABV0ZNC6_9TELE
MNAKGLLVEKESLSMMLPKPSLTVDKIYLESLALIPPSILVIVSKKLNLCQKIFDRKSAHHNAVLLGCVRSCKGDHYGAETSFLVMTLEVNGNVIIGRLN